MIVLATFIVWEKTLAALSGVAHAETMPAITFVGTTAAYLIGSALVLGLRHPMRWLLGAAGLFFLVGGLGDALSPGPYAVEPLLRSSGVLSAVEDSAAVVPFLCLCAGLIALWAAISRHKENR
jgi:hypothetical protein